MSDSLDPHADAQLRGVMEEQLRMGRWSLVLRPMAVAGVSLLVVLHAPLNPSRYMFTAVCVSLAAWIADAALARRAEAFRAMGEALRGGGPRRLEALRMDLSLYDRAMGWRRAMLSGARVRWFLPMVLLSAAVTIDAQRFGPDDVPGELVWYLALLIAALGAGSLAAWSWWLDRFGEEPARAPAQPRVLVEAPAAVRVAPVIRADDGELARWVPKHDPNERPFPDSPRLSTVPPPEPRSGSTQTFATVEATVVVPEEKSEAQ